MKDFIRQRWTDARFGVLYTGYVLTFITATTVTYADIAFVRTVFPSILSYGVSMFVFGSAASSVIGYFHRKHQLRTDVALTYGPLFEEIRSIVREENRRSREATG
jgi:hypothetical protein